MDKALQEQPKVSVIIAAYNVEKYIERAIQSALKQNNVAVEVIVINDGSTDNTEKVVTDIQDYRLKYISLPHNQGPSAARNAGLECANAQWVAILDADDSFSQNRLSQCLELAKKTKADIVVDNLNVIRESDGKEFLMFKPSFFNGFKFLDLAAFIKGNQSFLGGGVALGYLKPIFSADFLKKHKLKYDKTIHIGEDYMLLADALAKKAVCAVEHSAGYNYTARKGSTSHRLTLNNVSEILEGDLQFEARHTLNADQSAALRSRGAKLKEAQLFTELVNNIKNKKFFKTLRILVRDPFIIRYLCEAAANRFNNLFRKENIEDLLAKKVVLLFYKEYEADKFIKYDRYLKKILRPLYHLIHNKQKKSGFAVSFELMCRALIDSGYEVRINDYKTAEQNPNYPVGIVGFPLLLDNWFLPNPALLGPSLYDHPLLAPHLFNDTRFKKYVVLAPWTLDMFKPVYGDRCFSWFAGIDLKEWPDMSGEPKTYDFLIYDKIRWDYEEIRSTLLDPILRTLSEKGYSYKQLRYKMYDHKVFRRLLAGARGMIFICEHETQGLALQEAMAAGVPILAWDNGYWADPLWKKFQSTPPVASSVPFFSSECGEKFSNVTEFESILLRFREKIASYQPRHYVRKKLNMKISAKIYADEYFGLIK